MPRWTVNLATRRGAGGHAGYDTLIGIENREGSDHDDTLIGNTGDNVLRGDDGGGLPRMAARARTPPRTEAPTPRWR